MLLKLFFITLGFAVTSSLRIPFYRRDYTFFEDFDAFYKLHWDLSGQSWESAAYACEQEDAVLFYPKSPMEWTVVKNLSSTLAYPPNVTDIFVGIQNEGIEDFLTIDGLTTPFPIENHDADFDGKLCTVMTIETGIMRVHPCFDDQETLKPFVCKKVQPISCPTIDKDYVYYKDTNKCYKANSHFQTWHAALHTCVMEGGILAVIENNMEAEIIRKHIPANDILYHVGFRRTRPSNEYYTLKGQQLQKVYNEFYDNANEDCGEAYTQNSNLYLQSRPCHEVRKFICEITVDA